MVSRKKALKKSRKVKGLGSVVCKWSLQLGWNLLLQRSKSGTMGEQYFLTNDEQKARVKPTTRQATRLHFRAQGIRAIVL